MFDTRSDTKGAGIFKYHWLRFFRIKTCGSEIVFNRCNNVACFVLRHNNPTAAVRQLSIYQASDTIKLFWVISDFVLNTLCEGCC